MSEGRRTQPRRSGAADPGVLTDTLRRPLRDLRISVTDRCNFRCTYCMPKEVFGRGFEFLARSEILTFEETTRLARIFVAHGVRKLRITGGEPLVRTDVEQLIAMLAAIEGIEAAAEAGLSPLKVNMVVKRGVNDNTVLEMARYFREHGQVLRFIEYMDVGNANGWRLDDVVPAGEIIARIHAEMPLEPADPNYRGEGARRYRYADRPRG